MPDVHCKFPRFWDFMHHYNVFQLARALEMLQSFDVQGEMGQHLEGSRVPDERVNNMVVPALKYIQSQCEYLELPAAIARFQHFNTEIRQGITWAELKNQSKVLHEAIHADLCFRRFAYVPRAKAEVHDKFGLVWQDIWKKVPDCKEDSERAIDCYALEQNTACVFHLMRIAEIGLRALAKRVSVKIIHKGQFCPLEFGEWDKVITAIKNKIDTARKLPTGPKRQAQLEFYSDAADHCTFMKDIWRNNVSHARKPYNESEALAVLERVRDFMKFLATNLPEPRTP